jgi:hypothetical protein
MLRYLALSTFALLAVTVFAQSAKQQDLTKLKLSSGPVPAVKPVTLIAEAPEAGRSLVEDGALILGQRFTQIELNLDANFRAAFAKIYSDLDTAQKNLASKAGSDAEFAKLHLDADRSAIALLTPAQTDRLKQLALQAFGLEAFSISDVRDGLALTTEQRNLIDGVLKEWSAQQDSYGEKVAAVAAANPGADTQDPKAAQAASFKQTKAFSALKPEREKLTQAKAALTQKLMGLLDQDQKKAYAQMLGTKVTVTEPGW